MIRNDSTSVRDYDKEKDEFSLAVLVTVVLDIYIYPMY